MPITKWIKRIAEFRPIESIDLVPWNIRGIYALLNYRPRKKKYDVVYIGMAGKDEACIRKRLRTHRRSRKKAGQWTHFSIFEVFKNVDEEEVRELEGLLRHIFRKDSRSIRLGRARAYDRLKEVRINDLRKW
jgi:hypothetical protein